jgi:hypothetical protein
MLSFYHRISLNSRHKLDLYEFQALLSFHGSFLCNFNSVHSFFKVMQDLKNYSFIINEKLD